jgi:DNA-binding Lrp family transcriptional regulator
MDDLDFLLIKELTANSRATYRELADKLGLSVNSAHKRVQALVDKGIIKQFTAYLTPKALPQVRVRVCGKSATTYMDETVKRLGKNPDTSMIVISSGNSLHVVGVLRDVSEISRYSSFAIREGQIANPNIRLLDLHQSRTEPVASLTNTDYRIVASLQKNCRKQIVDIATELGISAKTVRRRLERMEKNGLIYYGIQYDHASLGGIFTLLDLYLKSEADSRETIALIRKKYANNLMEIRSFSTLPNNITIDVWTKTLTELKALQDSLQNEGFFENIVPIIEYNIQYFDSWCDKYVQEKALLKE